MRFALCVLTLVFMNISVYGEESAQSTFKLPVSNDSEAGIVVSDGNTKAQTFLIKQKNEYKKDAYAVKASGDYNKTETRDNNTGTTAFSEKWLLGLRFEYDITKDKFSTFAAQSASSDRVGGEQREYDTDIGGKYILIKKDTYYNFFELGYRYTKTYQTNDLGDKESHYIRLYNEAEKKWTPTFSNKLWAEYLPNMKDSDDYDINAELSLQAVLTNILSLKTAYLVKYRNEPPDGIEYKTDSLFTTSLIAKF